jgi:hypothetical protein
MKKQLNKKLFARSSSAIALFIAALVIVLFACSKSDTASDPSPTTGLATASETKPQYNNTSFGVYKGVIIGSTGTIVFRINNGDNVLKGYLVIDNVKDTLSTTQTVVSGQAINNVLFTGRISSMTLSANADGSNAIVSNISITGHNNVSVLIVHENSTKQVFCYEGTYSGNRSGTFNCARVGANNGDTAYVLARISDTAQFAQGYAQVNNNSATINIINNAFVTFAIQGSFSGNNFNGTWTWTGIGTGTFTCVRTY